MPGKHKVCASATGFIKSCRDIIVQKNDGLTHRVALEPDYAENKEELKATNPAQKIETATEETESSNAEWWILGGLALLGGAFLILFSL
jgi:hypothetical protein